MSLINEALKRAKQAHSQNLPSKASFPPMRPVEPEQSAPAKRFGAVVPIGLAVVAVAGLLIFLLIWKRDKDDAFSPSISITKGGGIALNVSGLVVVMPIEKWHALGASNWNRLQGLTESTTGKEPCL